jgi:hypothetical protein
VVGEISGDGIRIPQQLPSLSTTLRMRGLSTANSGDCKPEFEDFAISVDAKGETIVDRMFAASADGRQ